MAGLKIHAIYNPSDHNHRPLFQLPSEKGGMQQTLQIDYRRKILHSTNSNGRGIRHQAVDKTGTTPSCHDVSHLYFPTTGTSFSISKFHFSMKSRLLRDWTASARRRMSSLDCCSAPFDDGCDGKSTFGAIWSRERRRVREISPRERRGERELRRISAVGAGRTLFFDLHFFASTGFNGCFGRADIVRCLRFC